MTKLKTAFFILYLVAPFSAIMMVYYEAILLVTVQNWGYWLELKQLPLIGANLILFLSALMLLELIIQKITINKLKNKINEQTATVTSIKSKLYDQMTDKDAPNPQSRDDLNHSSLEENDEY